MSNEPSSLLDRINECQVRGHLRPQFSNYKLFGEDERALMYCSHCLRYYYRDLTPEESIEFRDSLRSIKIR